MFFGTRQSTMINYIVTKEAGGWQWSVEPFSGFQKLHFSKAGSEDIPSGNQTSQWLCHKPEGLIPNFGCGMGIRTASGNSAKNPSVIPRTKASQAAFGSVIFGCHVFFGCLVFRPHLWHLFILSLLAPVERKVSTCRCTRSSLWMFLDISVIGWRRYEAAWKITLFLDIAFKWYECSFI